MIKTDGTKIYQHREGEDKSKRVGVMLHNPNRQGKPEQREKFVYLGGLCLRASELRQMADNLEQWAGEPKQLTKKK